MAKRKYNRWYHQFELKYGPRTDKNWAQRTQEYWTWVASEIEQFNSAYRKEVSCDGTRTTEVST